MFAACDNKGFQIKFSNGYLISCQFGTQNYCERYGCGELFSEKKESVVSSDDCEIAIIDTVARKRESGFARGFVTGKIIEQMGLDIPNDDMVAGHVSADDVGKIIAYIKDLED